MNVWATPLISINPSLRDNTIVILRQVDDRQYNGDQTSLGGWDRRSAPRSNSEVSLLARHFRCSLKSRHRQGRPGISLLPENWPIAIWPAESTNRQLVIAKPGLKVRTSKVPRLTVT